MVSNTIKLLPLIKARMVEVLSTVDFVLGPDLLHVADLIDPLLGRAFCKGMHNLVVLGRQTGWLTSTGLQLERDELGLVLVLSREDLGERRQNRLEREGLELPTIMAQEHCLFGQELHLVAIGLNRYFFYKFTKRGND
jgi:hypothetical protein